MVAAARLLYFLRVRAVGRWTVQWLAFAVGSFLVLIALFRDLRGPARVPRDHGGIALLFPSTDHSLATARLRCPAAR